jgi:flagellin-like protein
MNRKAQSQIVGTVLLLLIVIAVGVILMTFVVPFVQERLEGTGCFDITGKVSIMNNPEYTCWNSSESEINLQVHFGDIDIETIKGLMIVTGGADSTSYKLIPGEGNSEVKNIGKNYNTALEFPGKNTERTFIIKKSGSNEFLDNIKIHAILEGDKTCEQSDIVNNLPSCK